jgi:hypothetical protein
MSAMALLLFGALIGGTSSANPLSEGDGRLSAREASRIPVQTRSVPLSFSLEEYAQNAVSGGPGKDGIPAIDEPRLVSAPEADRFLKADDVVFGVVLAGEVKAYPQKILVWHEIVNDRMGNENVSVTYCPLTGTAIGFLRGETSFGVSGSLVNNNLIMYDRTTDSRWPQILGTAMSGSLKGTSLEEFRVIWTTWKRWRERYPATVVLSKDTGYARNYHRDPYGSYTPIRGYYAKGRPPLFPLMHQDKRLDPKEVIIGARTENGTIVFKKGALREQKVMNGELGRTVYTAFYDPSLDTAYIYKNTERKRFTYRNGRFTDGQAQWTADTMPLMPVNTLDAMWFAWAAFYPKARLYD